MNEQKFFLTKFCHRSISLGVKIIHQMSDIIQNLKPQMFDSIGEKPLFQRVVDQIRIAIFQGKLHVGDKLPSEEELVNIFGVSRSVIREAIKFSESAGLLVVRRGQRGGIFVRERDVSFVTSTYADLLRLTLVDVSELTRTREILERAVIEEVSNNKLPSEDFDELRLNITEAKRHHSLGEGKKRLSQNIDFHLALARFSRSVVLEINLTAVLSLLHYYIEATRISSDMGESTIQAHLRILDLLERGETDEALIVNQGHIADISQRIIAYAEANGVSGLVGDHLDR